MSKMTARDPYNDFRFSKNVSSKFDQHRRFFVTRLRCTDFLPFMADIQGFDDDTRTKIRQTAEKYTPAEANEMFLETLRISNEQGKWLRFVEVLNKLGYELLREILTEEPDIARIRRSERFLEYIKPEIEDKVKPVTLLPYLDGYLDSVDKQAIEGICLRGEGDITGTGQLLIRVQRLKKDPCFGLKEAFRKKGMDTLIEVMNKCYEEFLERDAGDGVPILRSSFSRLDLRYSYRRRSGRLSGGLSDEEEATSPPERSGSPTLCEPKDLKLKQYQTELYSSVPRDKNTLIICPVKSGKRFVALKTIKEHLSLAQNPDGRVAYLVTKSKLADKVWRRCQVFLNDRPSAQIETVSSGDRLSKDLKENSIVITKAKVFDMWLKMSENVVNWTDFSMVILELGVDYYRQPKHVYKQIMKNYHDLRRQAKHLPQILVLTTAICGESPLEDLYCTAMETCATFDIEAIALVRKSINSLRQQVSIPFVERTAVPRKRDLGFDRMINELMSRTERAMNEHYHSNKMPEDHPQNRMAELIAPPTDRTSVKYVTWLKTNKATLGYASKKNGCKHAGFFLSCLRLATIYQSGLFIYTECGTFDALQYMTKKVAKLREKISESSKSIMTDLIQDFKGRIIYQSGLFIYTECGTFDALQYMTKKVAKLREKISESSKSIMTDLIQDFKDKEERLGHNCSRMEADTTAFAVMNKLAEIYQGNQKYKVVVLVKHREAILRMKFYLDRNLPHVKSSCVLAHYQDYTEETERLFKEKFDVLITTWPILAFHLGKEMRTWDYVMRTDCPGNDVITWTHHAEAQRVSQFAYPETELESPVDLFMESAIEKVTLEIAQQQQDSNGLYKAYLNDVQIAASERELWSRSTHSLVGLYEEMQGDFFCNGCGTFVCNRANVRNLDDLWLGLDPGLIHRLCTIRHSAQIVFSKGYAKLGRFVCKECGQKWGIIAHVLGKPHLAFAKEGLDYLVDGHLQEYSWKWKYADIEVEEFSYNRDLGRCLPASFCVEGETITELQRRLPDPVG